MDSNTDETRPGAQDSLQPPAGQPSEAENGSTSQNPRTYTEEAAKKMVSDALADQGRKHKEALKSLEDRLKALDSEKDARIDPFQLRKRIKELEEAAKGRDEELGQTRAELENERKLTAGSKRAALIQEIAKDYEDLDTARLAALCDKLNLTTPEQISAAADTLGTRRGASPVLADSGVTRGGAEDLSTRTPKELAEMGYRKKPKN